MRLAISSRAADEARREKRILRQFEEALRSNDCDAFIERVAKLDYVNFGWQWAFRCAARLEIVTPNIREAFLQAWLEYGDHIRQEVRNDLSLIRGLRVLLPSYKGGSPGPLFRGDMVSNWRRRTYGLSWSLSRNVADQIACYGLCRIAPGGSVLLEVKPQSEHIICVPMQYDNRFGEEEYILDRRHLRGVKALQRYPQLSENEFFLSKDAAVST